MAKDWKFVRKKKGKLIGMLTDELIDKAYPSTGTSWGTPPTVTTVKLKLKKK